MKKILLMSLVGALALSALSASAQNRKGRVVQGDRPVTTQGQKRHKTPPAKDADHAAMQVVMKDLAAAQKAMRNALPIYNGHRHRAIEIDNLASRVLRAAYVWSPNAPTRPMDVQAEVAKIGKGNEQPASKYPHDQVVRSHERMKQALAALQRAKVGLTHVQGAYGGSINEARQLVDLAMLEVDFALKGRP
ncbi:MAG: hypothetical protein JST30_11965 [Armatimonadetes bacterium]|nr:hypothetical protein [Armatimonadota bacterium]